MRNRPSAIFTLATMPDNSSRIQYRYGRLISISLPCPEVTPMRFLQAARGMPRCYWASTLDQPIFAGAGVALELMAWGQNRFKAIERQASDLFRQALVLDKREPLAAPRLFGGFAFRDDFVPDQAWSDFTPAHFVLPHYQLVHVGDASWLTLNVQVPVDDDPHALASELRAALQARIADLQTPVLASELPSPMQQLTYPMPFETWAGHIQQVTAQIKAGELQKVVLARIAEAICADRVAVEAALNHLTQVYPDTYRFLFEPRPYRAFFGATPELLASVHGSDVQTMALAGSIQRGASAQEDAALARQLLNSAKDCHEHQIVVDALRTRLTPLTTDLRIGTTRVKTLSNIQHLYTPVEAELRHSCGILPVVETLHPTPALGGDPRDVAAQMIAAVEPFPRGWYASPVGWIDYHMDGVFCVAIRSAVAQNERAWLYAGAGIVGESDPRREWDETALKFRPMLEALSR